MSDVAHAYADVRDIRVHYAHAGDGPLIVFLHGLPRCWYLWRHQLADFSSDHLAVAPDLRGYNLTSKPPHDLSYGVWQAVEDLRALVRQLGHERFQLVGHDVGGRVAWSFALHYPEMLERMVVLNAPHPALLDRELRDNPRFQQTAQYMLTLRDPEAPRLLAENDFALLRPTIDLPFVTDHDRELYLEAWRQPGALRAMTAWNRREGLGPPTDDGTPARGNYVPELLSLVVNVPTLVLHPTDDDYDDPDCFKGLEHYVRDLDLRKLEGTHWLPEEHPELVTQLIREFISRPAAAPAG